LSDLQILWSGPLYGESGYAEETRCLIQNFDDAKIPIAARNIGFELPSAAVLSNVLTRVQQIESRGIRSNFVHVTHLYKPFFTVHEDAIARVWRTMFETDVLPPNWVDKANSLDQIWVPSQFNIETFTKAGVVPTRLRILPQTVDVKRWTPEGVQYVHGDPNLFTFLSIFRWQQRKGWDILIRAFVEEFTDKDAVQLVLKAAPFHVPESSTEMQSPDIKSELSAVADKALQTRPGGIPMIIHHSDWVEAVEMPAFLRGADCYVLPSRGEGWGRPYIEAMSCGLPVIATNWSGNLDFMDENTALLIDYSLQPVRSTATDEWPLFTADMVWAEADIEHLRSLMRAVFVDRDLGTQIGQAARSRVVEDFSGPGAAAVAINLISEVT